MAVTTVSRSARPAGSRKGYALTAAILVAVMLGGTLPIPLYTLYEPQMGFGPLGRTVVFAVYVIGTLTRATGLRGPERPFRSAQGLGGRHRRHPRCDRHRGPHLRARGPRPPHGRRRPTDQRCDPAGNAWLHCRCGSRAKSVVKTVVQLR